MHLGASSTCSITQHHNRWLVLTFSYRSYWGHICSVLLPPNELQQEIWRFALPRPRIIRIIRINRGYSGGKVYKANNLQLHYEMEMRRRIGRFVPPPLRAYSSFWSSAHSQRSTLFKTRSITLLYSQLWRVSSSLTILRLFSRFRFYIWVWWFGASIPGTDPRWYQISHCQIWVL